MPVTRLPHVGQPDDDGLLNIGPVVDQLAAEFPGLISIPKIRYLEREGLLTPQRTPSGYRKFSHEDVARLRYILTMQRDHYLPHKVIAENLAALDRGEEIAAPASPVPASPAVVVSSDGMPSPAHFRHRDDLRLSRKELVKLAGIGDEFLSDLESLGLVKAHRATGLYDTDALGVAQVAQQLAEFGIEARHLRGLKTAADREVGLIEQVVAPYRKSTDSATQGRAEDMAAEVAALAVKLHATLVRGGLRGR